MTSFFAHFPSHPKMAKPTKSCLKIVLFFVSKKLTKFLLSMGLSIGLAKLSLSLLLV
jgi:hypothetical protein